MGKALLSLAAIAVTGLFLFSLVPRANAQVGQLASPGMIMVPTTVKPGDKTLVSIWGYLANSQLSVQLVGYGTFPSVTTDSVGHAVLSLTIPNLISGSYTLRVSDSAGNALQRTFTVTPTANTPNPTYPAAIFSHYLIPQYYRQNPTLLTNLVLEVKNVFITPTVVSVAYFNPSINQWTTLFGSITLQPGQTYVYSSTARSLGTLATAQYRLTASSTGGSFLTDEINVIQYGTYPTNGDSPNYPETFDTLASLGTYAPFPQPPTNSVCPPTAHLDYATGHCLDNVTGACVDCGNPIASIQLTESNNLSTGNNATVFNFQATGKDQNQAIVKNPQLLFLFANHQLLGNASISATTGIATFPVVFHVVGTYSIQAADNPTDASPVNSNILTVTITNGGSGGGGGGGGNIFNFFGTTIAGIPLWVILLAVISIVGVYYATRKKHVKVHVRRHR